MKRNLIADANALPDKRYFVVFEQDGTVAVSPPLTRTHAEDYAELHRKHCGLHAVIARVRYEPVDAKGKAKKKGRGK